MLGLVLIYFIGKQFYKLADTYDKSKWGFAVLGVVSYYGGTFLLGVGLSIYWEMTGDTFIDTSNTFSLTLLALPFGLLSATGIYFLLRYLWKKNQKPEENLIEEIGKS